MKPILAFLPFCSRSVLGSLQAEDVFIRPQAIASYQKSTRGKEQKGMQKSDKKSAYIPYLDNIEITSIKIFAKTTEISGKIKDLWYNRYYSKCLISLIVFFGDFFVCGRILVGSHYQERFGFSLGISYDWDV